MYSYPNLIPLGPDAIRGIVAALEPYEFERIVGTWWGRISGRRQGDRAPLGRALPPCDQLSVAHTCRLQRRSLFHYLADTLEARARAQPAPSLLPP